MQPTLWTASVSTRSLSLTNMTEPLPPPIYSQQADELHEDTSCTASDPQILIIPSSDAINFQKGYLGAEEERAAIEGEIQIKGAESGHWARVQVVVVLSAPLT